MPYDDVKGIQTSNDTHLELFVNLAIIHHFTWPFIAYHSQPFRGWQQTQDTATLA